MSEKNKGPLLAVCILNGKEFLDRTLEAYLELGIQGATVMQSQGMGQILVRDFPLFAGFKDLLEAGGPFNYTIMAVIHDTTLINEIKDILPTLKENENSKGVFFTLPVTEFFKIDSL